MPVNLTTPIVPSVPSYDKVHMDNLVISIEKTDYGKITLQARIRLYYQDSITGIKTFSDDFKEIYIEDTQVWITEKAAQGDMRGVEAATKIKEILSLIVATQTNWGNSTIS